MTHSTTEAQVPAGVSERMLDIFKSVSILSGIVTVSPNEEELVQLGGQKRFITDTLLACAGEEISFNAINAQNALDTANESILTVASAGLRLSIFANRLLNVLEDAGIEVDEDGHRVIIQDDTDEVDDIPF